MRTFDSANFFVNCQIGDFVLKMSLNNLDYVFDQNHRAAR